MPNTIETADDLRQDFHELYGNGHDFEGETLAEILIRIGNLVGDLVGQDTASALLFWSGGGTRTPRIRTSARSMVTPSVTGVTPSVTPAANTL